MARRRGRGKFLREARGDNWKQGIAIEGGDELRAALRKMSDTGSGLALEVAVDKGAVVLEREMAAQAPRDRGKLARNITRAVGRTTRTASSIKVGPSEAAYYGRFRETGTSTQKADPFMRRSLDMRTNKIVDTIAAELRRGIERLGY